MVIILISTILSPIVYSIINQTIAKIKVKVALPNWFLSKWLVFTSYLYLISLFLPFKNVKIQRLDHVRVSRKRKYILWEIVEISTKSKIDLFIYGRQLISFFSCPASAVDSGSFSHFEDKLIPDMDIYIYCIRLFQYLSYLLLLLKFFKEQN